LYAPPGERVRNPQRRKAPPQQLQAEPVEVRCLVIDLNSLAAALAELTPPGLEIVFFCNSGTEAVEAAIKLARAASGRTDLLSCERSFHAGAWLTVRGTPTRSPCPAKRGRRPCRPWRGCRWTSWS